MAAYYRVCCTVGMKYLLAAELRQLLGTFSVFNLISAKKPFLEATVSFLNNSASPLSDGRKLIDFTHSVR